MRTDGSLRRRAAEVVVVGGVEPEIQSWLRAEGHKVHANRRVDAALAALAEVHADLVIAGPEASGLASPDVCRALRQDPRLQDAWILAITPASQRRTSDAALRAGADDYVHRPFTRGELLARVRAGQRAVQQRTESGLLRALMVNVPGAIYRSAWHDGHRLELVSEEIERITGYPPVNFMASARRTLMGMVHPDDRDRVERAVAEALDAGEPFALEYRIVRADGTARWVLDRGQLVKAPGGRLWMDGAIFDVTERRAAEEALRAQEIEQARAEELRSSRVRIVQAADGARRKIERDLHDGAQQRLVSLAIEVQLARRRVADEPESAAPFLEHLHAELAEASAELRELARGIHPAVLTERGLSAAVTALASRAPLPVEVIDLPADRLPQTVEAAAYFTVAEALTNVAKYAEATHATVRLACENGDLIVEVRDDGVGGARAEGGSGLSGLTDRIGACEGSLHVDSPPGEGTLVRAVLPLQT